MENQNTPVKAQNPKQQVVEALKNANNILVTVSTNPSVDQLAACIGFALMMNKLDKHATAVFSGAIPSTIEFLEPEKTLELTTDSLRDFIISLDKSKADKLRYKVEDDVVRIYITPYRTSITSADLEFTQGDFNVDVVVALGVDNKDHLDQAIIEHGRILHDAVVLGLSCGENGPSELGSINWHESSASSLSEMLVSISESFKTGLLDTQMSTAFLTGIVAETDRFSNNKTTPKVMTMSAQLMAAGANQQLIATQLAIQPDPEPEQMPVTSPEPAETEPEVITPPVTDEPGVLRVEQEEDVSVMENINEPSDSLPQAPVTPENQLPEIEQGSQDDSLEFSLRKEETKAISVDDVAETLGASGEDVTKTDDDPTELQIDKAPEIEIDEHGKLTDLEAEAADEADKKSRQGHKVIQPLSKPPEAPKTDLSSYVFEEPQNGGTLTANSVPDHERVEQPIDPLSGSMPDQPVAVAPPDALATPPPVPVQEPEVPPQASDDDFDVNAPPQTLADLEVAVESPHVDRPQDEQETDESRKNSPPPVPPPLPNLPTSNPDGEIHLPPPGV